MEIVKTEFKNKTAKSIIKNGILNLLKGKESYNIVVLCVGSNKSGGDSMAPFVGTFLDKIIDFPVFGTLKNPVTIRNLKQTLRIINEKYEYPYVIAVAGGLSNNEDEIGTISVIDEAITPGKGIGNNSESIGDLSITGIINSVEDDAFESVQTANMYIVLEIAKAIANGIIEASYEL